MQRRGLSALLFCSSKSPATKSDHERLIELQQQIDVLKNELTDTVDVSVNVLDQRISDLETTLRLHLQTVYRAVQAYENPAYAVQRAARAGAVDLEADSPNPDMEIEMNPVVPYSRNYSAGADRAGTVDGILVEDDLQVASLNPVVPCGADAAGAVDGILMEQDDLVLPGSADRAGAADGIMTGMHDYIDVICQRDITKKNFNRTDSFICADLVELVKHHSQQLNFAPICEDGVTTWQCLVCLCRVDSSRNMISHCRGKRHRCELIEFKGDHVMRESDWARLEASCRCLGQFWR
jgi:hypothetical protein